MATELTTSCTGSSGWIRFAQPACEIFKAWHQGTQTALNRSQAARRSRSEDGSGQAVPAPHSVGQAMLAHQEQEVTHEHLMILLLEEHQMAGHGGPEDSLMSRATHSLFCQLLTYDAVWLQLTKPLKGYELQQLKRFGESLDPASRNSDQALRTGIVMALQRCLIDEFGAFLKRLRERGAFHLLKEALDDFLMRSKGVSVDPEILEAVVPGRFRNPAEEAVENLDEEFFPDVSAGELTAHTRWEWLRAETLHFVENFLDPAKDGPAQLWADLVLQVLGKQMTSRQAVEPIEKHRGKRGTYDKFCDLTRRLRVHLIQLLGKGGKD